MAPRLLLCLRIKHSVTTAPARLDSGPVASAYLGGLSTYKTMRPCQAATKGAPHPIPGILAKCIKWHALLYFPIDPNGAFWYFVSVIVLPLNDQADNLT